MQICKCADGRVLSAWACGRRIMKRKFLDFRMSVLEENIKRINDKIQQLLKSCRLLQKDNERQTRLIVELQGSKEKDAQHIVALQEQVNILKAAAGQMTETDKKAFEKNISQYIREIDKCIGLLSE